MAKMKNNLPATVVAVAPSPLVGRLRFTLRQLVFFNNMFIFYSFVISLDFKNYFFVFSSKFRLVVHRIHTHICMYSQYFIFAGRFVLQIR